MAERNGFLSLARARLMPRAGGGADDNNLVSEPHVTCVTARCPEPVHLRPQPMPIRILLLEDSADDAKLCVHEPRFTASSHHAAKLPTPSCPPAIHCARVCLAPYCQCCALKSSTKYWLRSNVTPLGVRAYTNCEAMLFARVCAYQLGLPMSLDAGLGSWPEIQSNGP